MPCDAVQRASDLAQAKESIRSMYVALGMSEEMIERAIHLIEFPLPKKRHKGFKSEIEPATQPIQHEAGIAPRIPGQFGFANTHKGDTLRYPVRKQFNARCHSFP